MKDTIVADTIVKVSNTIYRSAPESIDLINQVNSFYDSAWNKLLLVATVIGVLVPLFFNWYQNNQSKISRKKLKKNIVDEVEQVKAELREEIKNEYKAEIKKLDLYYQQKIHQLTGRNFHIEGNVNVNAGLYIYAVSSYLSSLLLYAKGKDQANFKIVMKALTINTLPLISKSQLIERLENDGSSINEYFKRIKEAVNSDPKFEPFIEELKTKIDQLPDSR